MPRDPDNTNAEFAPFRNELNRADLPVPPLDMELIESMSSNSKQNEAAARDHHEQRFRATVGARRPVLLSLQQRLDTLISKLKAELDRCEGRRAGRSPDVLVDTGEKAVWSLASRVQVGVLASASLGLLVVGWVLLTVTFKESGFESFDGWFLSGISSLLPGLGITFGWKTLGALKTSPAAERRFWKAITWLGLILGATWLVAVASTIGSETYGSIDITSLDTYEEYSSGGHAGAFALLIVICGVLSETLLAASSWRRLEEECDRHRRVRIEPNQIDVVEGGRASSLDGRLTEGTAIQGELAARIDQWDTDARLFGDLAVAALTPIWRRPAGQSSSLPSTSDTHLTHPDVPGVHRNGNHMEQLA